VPPSSHCEEANARAVLREISVEKYGLAAQMVTHPEYAARSRAEACCVIPNPTARFTRRQQMGVETKLTNFNFILISRDCIPHKHAVAQIHRR
jgi:hypothetical protein